MRQAIAALPEPADQAPGDAICAAVLIDAFLDVLLEVVRQVRVVSAGVQVDFSHRSDWQWPTGHWLRP